MDKKYLIRNMEQWDKYWDEKFPGHSASLMTHKEFIDKLMTDGITISKEEGGYFYITFSSESHETMFFLKHG